MKGRHVIEKKWASEKYNVMWHSQKYYNRIREEMNKGSSMDLLVKSFVLKQNSMSLPFS